MADVEELPTGTDLVIRCVNVRTVDGKRPSFVHDMANTFVLPLSTIRMIEAPPGAIAKDAAASTALQPAPEVPEFDEEQEDEAADDLLARIREL